MSTKITTLPKSEEQPQQRVRNTKQLYREAVQTLQQAKELTHHTDELEELVRLPIDKQREICASKFINHAESTTYAKRLPSDRDLHAESQSSGCQQRRDKDRTTSCYDTETGGQWKDAPNHEGWFTGDLPHDIKGLHKDALHSLEQALRLTQQTDELEELVRLPRDKPRKSSPSQANSRPDPVRLAKRSRSGGDAEVESHLRDGNRRRKNRKSAHCITRTGEQRTGFFPAVRRLSSGLDDRNEQLRVSAGRDEELRVKRDRVSQDVETGTGPHDGAQLVNSGELRASKNKGTCIHGVSCVRQVREITRKEASSCKELYQEAMEALELAKELTRHTDQLEYLCDLEGYVRRKKLSKPITLVDQ